MKKAPVNAKHDAPEIKPIGGIKFHTISEVASSEWEAFLSEKIKTVKTKIKKTTAFHQPVKIQQRLTESVVEAGKRTVTAKAAHSRKHTGAGDVDVLEKPVKKIKAKGTNGANGKHGLNGGSADGNIKIFKATVSAFGSKAVAADAVVQQDRTDINLAVAEDNFTFDQLFKDFDCENLSFFVFDDVNIHLKQKEEGDTTVNAAWFNATLRMDQSPLSDFKNFLGCEDGLLISGEIDTAGQDISQKISPSAITLTSAASFLLNIAEGITLKSATFNIALNKKEDDGGKWIFTVTATGTLQINKLGNAPVELNATATYTDGTLKVEAENPVASGLFGIDNLSLQNVVLDFSVGNENEISLNADLQVAQTTFHFSGKITAEGAGMLARISTFTLDDLGNLFNNITGDHIAAPDFDVSFEDVYLSLATADITIDSTDVKKGLSTGCKITAYEHSGHVSAVVSTTGIEFNGALDDLSIGPVDITKANMSISLNAASTGKPSSFALTGEAIIESLTLDCKIAYEKNTDGTSNQLVYAAIAANEFGLSSVFPAAKGSFLDTFRFSKIAFIYSSDDAETDDPDFDFEVKQGLQLIGVMEDIQALSTLTHSNKAGLIFSAHYGNTTDLSIAIADTRINLGPSVVCDELKIGIVLTPEPAMSLLFGIAVTVPKQSDPLHFDLMLELGIAEARGSATMKGYWVNPFGVNGLKIGPELALQIGIIYAQFVSTGLPSEFGFAGGLQLGDIIGKLAVNISEDPMHEILMGEVDNLSTANLISFINGATGASINAADVPNFFELEQLKLYCAPTGGNIGTITYEPGFSFNANLLLFEKQIDIYALLNDSGITAKGEMDAIEIGPLKISGTDGGNPRFDLELTTEEQSVVIDGGFEFLGIGESVSLDISNKGISFELEQKFTDLLKFIIKAQSSGSLDDMSNLDFSLYGEFDNNLTNYLKTTVVQKISDAKSAADTSIDAAQKQVDKAENDYMAQFAPARAALDKAQSDATAYLNQCTKNVSDQKAAWDKKIGDAQAAVGNAKATYDNAITDAQNKVTQAKAAYDTSMQNAQQQVDNAQAAYNYAFAVANYNLNNAITNYNNSFGQAYNDLNNAQAAVNSLQSQINNYQYKIDHAGWKDYFGNVEAWGVAIAGLKIAIGTANVTLSACRAVVNGFQYSSTAIAVNTARATLYAVQTGGNAIALQSAKNFLYALQYGAGWVAFQSAQNVLNGLRYGAQYTVWQSAIATLNAAQTTGRDALTAAEYALNNFGTSAVSIALKAAQATLDAVKQGTAAAAFETAKSILAGTKHSVDDMLALGAYIAAHSGDILQINKITVSANLKSIQQGHLFKSSFDGAVFGKPYQATLDFDVKDTVTFVENLFQDLLGEAKQIASA